MEQNVGQGNARPKTRMIETNLTNITCRGSTVFTFNCLLEGREGVGLGGFSLLFVEGGGWGVGVVFIQVFSDVFSFVKSS